MGVIPQPGSQPVDSDAVTSVRLSEDAAAQPALRRLRGALAARRRQLQQRHASSSVFLSSAPVMFAAGSQHPDSGRSVWALFAFAGCASIRLGAGSRDLLAALSSP